MATAAASRGSSVPCDVQGYVHSGSGMHNGYPPEAGNWVVDVHEGRVAKTVSQKGQTCVGAQLKQQGAIPTELWTPAVRGMGEYATLRRADSFLHISCHVSCSPNHATKDARVREDRTQAQKR